MSRIKKDAAIKRKAKTRKTRAETKVKAEPVKIAKPANAPVKTSEKSAGSNRAEGIRLFKLAGRPTKEQFIAVYGERGPKMTWTEREKAGVPAEKFQDALAAKQSARLSIPAPSWKD
jgi:hypothetical protein